MALLDVLEIDVDTFATVLELCEGGDLDGLLREHKACGGVGHTGRGGGRGAVEGDGEGLGRGRGEGGGGGRGAAAELCKR